MVTWYDDGWKWTQRDLVSGGLKPVWIEGEIKLNPLTPNDL
jgi:hypothetical protein